MHNEENRTTTYWNKDADATKILLLDIFCIRKLTFF